MLKEILLLLLTITNYTFIQANISANETSTSSSFNADVTTNIFTDKFFPQLNNFSVTERTPKVHKEFAADIASR